MKSKLKGIADITSGIYAKTYSSGEVYYLQARDFDQYRRLKRKLEPNVLWNRYIEKHFLNAGDLLIAAKGFDHFAAVYNKMFTPAVASSMFIVLRNIDQSKCLPEYIAWYINHPAMQLFLKNISKGTSLPSLSKKAIGEIEIDLPSMERQQIVMKISALSTIEKRLRQDIESLRETLINRQVLNALNA